MTRPIKIVSSWERFKRWTVWHPINTDPKDEDRWGPRFWYPTYDLWALALGIYAYFLGSPLLNQLFPDWFTDIMSVLLVTAAVICLIGVCFPKLVILELTGKLAIVFFLGAFAGTVAFYANTDEPNGFLVIVLIMSVWLLGPRVSKIFAQRIKIRAERRVRRHGQSASHSSH